MAPTLAILGASGKLGLATLRAILSHSLLPPSNIIALTSASSPSAPQHALLQSLSPALQIRHATFDDPSSIAAALHGVDRLLLISSPRISLDFHSPAPGQGREADHIAAIAAATQAGVRHIYYTSLAFARPSKAGVMRAHVATEAHLEGLGGRVGWTVLREGLYNESWPLYLGHWRLGEDERGEVRVAGDSRISWTAIQDLGLGTALIVAGDEAEWRGKTAYLSNTTEAKSLRDVAVLVSEKLGRKVEVEIVDRAEHERFYIEDRDMDPGMVEWWASTYDALKDEECLVRDDTLKGLLESKGVEPKSMEETIAEMLS